MHAAAYRALGLDCTYEAIQVTTGDLARLVRALRDGAYDGFNVTVPHKRSVLAHVDRVDAGAADAEAANTLVRLAGGAIAAYNTDGPALASELAKLAPERTKEEWAASTAIVIGAGGAGRASVLALTKHLGVRDVVVRARRADGRTHPLVPSLADREARTIVQCTSAGMEGADPGDPIAAAVGWSVLPTNAVALDVVYAPRETPFLRAAAARGLRCANGLGMLAAQGALAFERWLGVPAPYEAMLAALGSLSEGPLSEGPPR